MVAFLLWVERIYFNRNYFLNMLTILLQMKRSQYFCSLKLNDAARCDLY